MASTSLGTLTLDLAVRLSEFTDGLTRAERQARDSTNNINNTVTENLGKAALAFGAMAATGVAVAGAALVSFTVESAKADVQLSIMAKTASTSLKSFQTLSYAAQQLGIEQDALGGILGDVQEKLGEFSATGGGGAADFFEALQNNTKMTDEEIRNLGKTLQGKDGAEAIQLVKDKMDALGATSQEQRFVFESLASDLGNLMPLFADGGDILNKYGEELEAAGVIKTEAAIEQSRRLTAQTQAVTTQFDGFKTQLASQMMPVLNSLMGYFVDGKTKGGQFGTTMESVGLIAKTVAAGIVGVAGGIKLIVRLVQAFGEQVANIGITTSDFFDADGLVNKAKALRDGARAYVAINMDLGADIITEFKGLTTAIGGMYESSTKPLNGLAGALYATSDATQVYNDGLAVNAVDAAAAAAAEGKLAAAKDKTSKAISNQMMVYKAFKSAGLSDNQARIITAEVGRENDYQSQYLFGGHSDPKNNQYNLGMISWQKERGKELNDYLKELGLIQNGQIVKTQEALNAQAMFALKEITTNPRFDRTKKEFLSNPDVSYDKGTEVLGNNYIAWRYKDPKYSNGHNRRDKHYNKLNSELGSDSTMKVLQAENKAIEDTLKRRNSIQVKYASEREKLDLEHTNNMLEIEVLYSKDSAEYVKYSTAEKARYDEKRTATAKSILESYMADEEKLTYEHNKKIERINVEFAEDDQSRQLLIDLQNAAYQEDLANFRFAAQAKAREQDKYYQSIAQSMRENRLGAASTGLDAMAQRTMSGQDYETWRLAQDHDEAFNSVNGQYAGRQNEINARDERGDFLLPELERNELLETARQEHLDAMWSMEQEFALKQQQLDEAQKSARIEMYQGLFGGLAGLTKSFFGEQSAAHKVFFGIEKGFAIAQSAIAIQQAVAKAMALGFPQNIPFIGAAVAQGASIMSNLQSVSVDGIAHGGLDYVPKESTYLLDKGERVLSPNQNSDLTKFMQGDKSGLTINNYSSAKVEASSDGKTITITDVRNEARSAAKSAFANLQNPNSFESKQLTRNTQTQRRR